MQTLLRTFTTIALFGLGLAAAADPLRIGVILPLSGPYAAYGKQIDHGIRLYLQESGGSFAGRKVELIVRDDQGTNVDSAARAAQELVSKDHVDILAGFGLTPQALGAAGVSAETHKPMVIMNAAASVITTKSPYIVRTSMTLPQVTAPIAQWAAGGGLKTAYTLVADYGPGIDAETQFKKTYAAAGGLVVGEARVPLKTADFAPLLQKVRDLHPATIFLFLPPGEQTQAFLKAYRASELDKAGVRLVATGDLTDDDSLDSLGDNALKLLTTHHYSAVHDSAENKAYTAAYARAYPQDRPGYMSVAAYDGMRLIDEVLKKTGGDAEGDKFIAAARGLQWISPRGPVSIDPRTRDIVQTVYIRKVVRIGAHLVNQEFGKVDAVRDPGKG